MLSERAKSHTLLAENVLLARYAIREGKNHTLISTMLPIDQVFNGPEAPQQKDSALLTVFPAHHLDDPPLPVHGGGPNLRAADGGHALPHMPEQRLNNFYIDVQYYSQYLEKAKRKRL